MILVDDFRRSRTEQHDEAAKAGQCWHEEGMAEALDMCKTQGNDVLRRFIEPKEDEERAKLSEVLKEITRVRDATRAGGPKTQESS